MVNIILYMFTGNSFHHFNGENMDILKQSGPLLKTSKEVANEEQYKRAAKISNV